MIQLQAVVTQQLLGLVNPHVGQILVDGGSGPPFKKTGQIGGREVYGIRQILNTQAFV